MLPGLLVCAVFGWAGLQRDATMHGRQRHFKEAEKFLKSVGEGKAPVIAVAPAPTFQV